MPVTDFQREVLGVIAANRDELSHFAGGLVLKADAASTRTTRQPVLRKARVTVRSRAALRVRFVTSAATVLVEPL